MRRPLFQFNSSVLDEDAGENKKQPATEIISHTTAQTYKQDC